MEERNKLILLYDYYGELLSELQKEYFEDYYFNNLSLAEISEKKDVSRNAVHKQIKSAEAKLENMESKLKIIYKKNKLLDAISSIKDEKLKDKIQNIIES